MVAKTQALIVICGPTATGKSGLAMAIAQSLDSVILSADSRQVYRGFDIGTAKPTAAEQRQVPHALIDLCDPSETLTLGDYQQQAQALIAQGQAQLDCGCPLLVGGTGLYLKSITRGLRIPRVPPQPGLRAQLAHLGQTHNYALLRSVDLAAAERIHPNDALRTQRALEVFYATGRPISVQRGEAPPGYPILQIGLDCPDPPGQARSPNVVAGLGHRIARRVTAMVEAGFVAEVEALVQRYGPDLPLLKTLGYGEICRYLRGEWDLDEALAQTVLHTRQFAKRQRTWFRAVPGIEWFDADAPDLQDRVWARVGQFLAAIA